MSFVVYFGTAFLRWSTVIRVRLKVNETLKATSNLTCFFTAEGKKENVKDYRRNGKMRCTLGDLWEISVTFGEVL